MIPGAEVTVVKFAPMGDPMELQIHGYELTLRLAEAEQIEIKPIDKRSNSHAGSERIQPSVPVSYTHLFEMACLDTHNSEASCSCDKLLSFLNFCNLLENVIIYIASPSCFLYSTITQVTKLLKKLKSEHPLSRNL